MYQTGSYPQTTLKLFQKTTDASPVSIQMCDDEDKWIQLASTGGITWAEQYTGPGQELDYESMYPLSLVKIGTLWPIRKGNFEYLENLDNITFGIYRVSIEGQPVKKQDVHCTRLFRYNPTSYYTHYDIKRAEKLGLKVTLLNESPNALIYSEKSCMTGEDMFGK